MDAKLPKINLFFSLVLLILLSSSFLFLFSKIQKLESAQPPRLSTETPLPTFFQDQVQRDNLQDNTAGASGITKEEVEKIVSEAVATLSGTTQVIEKTVTQTSTPSTRKQTSYVTMDGTYSSSLTSWVDVPGSEVYLDIANDFSSSAIVTWEASLKVAYGNGTAFARLWDDTHKIAVDGSELSTTANSSYEQVASGNLPFWRGKNLYKVQIKSLKPFDATFTGGRIKIVY